MPSVEKAWALSYCQLRLLFRSRAMLAGMVGLPLIGGLCFGLAGIEAAESPAPYGLLLVLLISSLLLTNLNSRIGSLAPMLGGLAKPAIVYTSWALAAFLVLAAQVALYVGVTAVLEPESVPGLGVLAGALALSLAIGLAACRLRRPR